MDDGAKDGRDCEGPPPTEEGYDLLELWTEDGEELPLFEEEASLSPPPPPWEMGVVMI